MRWHGVVAWMVCAGLFAAVASATVVDDVTRLNPIEVARVATPRTVADVQQLVASHRGPISIGGGRYSMGGQTATPNGLQIDMRRMDHVLAFDPVQRTIDVEAGITWREIQAHIDPANLALRIMQSYANFTVGGSLSVNVHGRYVNQGPLIYATRWIEVVLADGTLVHASRTERPDVFYGAIGGLGGVGVIVAASFDLDPNEPLERSTEVMPVSAYRAWFDAHVRGSTTAVFHNADLYPPAFTEVRAITYARTTRPPTVPEHLRPAESARFTDRWIYQVVEHLPAGDFLRREILDPLRFRGAPVVWRNYEASYHVGELEPWSRAERTYVLQEYFVPVAQLEAFVPAMAAILQEHHVDVVNVSIRHAQRDPGTLLAWARDDCFALVLYYAQGTSDAARAAVGEWTRALIDAALNAGGTYYLPYQLHATVAQFERAYPRAGEFATLKARLDPSGKFTNSLWDKYLPTAPSATAAATHEQAIAARLRDRPGYLRPEDQTFLTLPEWYIVYSADEEAAFLVDGLPSQFPWFGSVAQFWSLRSAVARATGRRYPYNWGYQAMIWTIGASFTIENGVKGAYEHTIGRLVERISLRDDPARRSDAERFAASVVQEYATFIHATPWYAFPFGEKLHTFWTRPSADPQYTFRRVERTGVVTTGLIGKAVWAKMMGAATGAAYAPEDETVTAWARLHGHDLQVLLPEARILERLGSDDDVLISVPRYEPFTRAALALARGGVELVEVAGNRRIVVQMIAPTEWTGAPVWGEVVAQWPILTQPGRQRVTMEVPVGELDAVVPALDREGVTIDHVYDY